MKQFMKNGRRGLALFLAMVMCLSMLQLSAFAAQPECETCNGIGTVGCTVCGGSGLATIDCATCGGTGAITAAPAEGEENGEVHSCSACEGKGTVTETCTACEEGVITCDACKGTGKVETGEVEPEPEKCNCETKCTEGNPNAGCPVCGAEGADLSTCEGTEPEVKQCNCEIKCTEGNPNASCPVCGAEGADLFACEGTEPEVKQCNCEIKCTEGNPNADCPVCGAEGADLSTCEGTEPEVKQCNCEIKCTEGNPNADCPVCGDEDADLSACEGKEVSTEISAEVQAFLNAVAALPLVEEIPEEATEAEIAALSAKVDACRTALNALTKEDMEREDVIAATETMNKVSDAVSGIRVLEEVGRPLDRWDMMSEEERTALLDSFTESGLYRSTDWSVVVFKGEPDAPFVWPGLFDQWTANGYGDHQAEIRKVVKELIVVGNVDFSHSAHKITSGECWYKLEKITLNDVNLPDESTVFTKAGGSIALTVNGGSIGARAFSNSGIKTATLNNVAVGERAFECSMGLTEVTVNGGSIGNGAFASCGLSNVTMNGIETIPDEAFRSCQNLKNVQAEDATDIGKLAFAYCTSLKELSLPKASSVGYGIISNSGVETVTIGRPKTLVWFAFQSDSNLKNVTLGSSDYTWNVVEGDIGDSLFCDFNGEEPLHLTLTNVNFPDYKTTTAPFRNLRMGPNGRLHLTVNGGKLGRYTFYNCTQLSSVDLNNVTIADKKYPFYKAGAAGMTATITGGSLGTNSFYGSKLTEVTLNGIHTIPKFSFAFCTYLEEVELGDVMFIDGCAFEKCGRLNKLTLNDDTQLGHINTSMSLLTTGENPSRIDGLYDRVAAILAGKFDLDTSPVIEQLVRDTETAWTSVTEGKENENYNSYDYATQLIEHARWTNPGSGASDNTVAEVRVDAYYTVPAQMDFIFVLDCSRSMSDLGNPTDMNARFYDMQSKLLDMTDKLLHSDSFYDCQVAFTTFGGAYTGELENGKPGHVEGQSSKSNFFGKTEYEDALEAIQAMNPYYNNTDYGLGLQGALELAQSNTGRKTSVIFISDGRPYIGDNNEFEDESSGDYTGAATAAEIRALENVEIYGVLQSVPAGELEAAQAAMKEVCTDGLFFTATDTDTFSQAVNRAIEASFGTLTLTLPVNPVFEGVIGNTLHATTDDDLLPGEESTAQYDAAAKTITWTIINRPFEKHTLTYELRLSPNADGTYPEGEIPVNDPNKPASLDWAEEGRPANPIDPPVLPRRNPVPEVGSLTITKVLAAGAPEAAAEQNFQFTVTGENFAQAVTITGAGSVTLDNLAPGTYTVTEVAASAAIEGYSWTNSGADTATVTANNVASVSITNTYTRNTPTVTPDPEPSYEPDPTPSTSPVPSPTPDPVTPTPSTPVVDVPEEETPLAPTPEVPAEVYTPETPAETTPPEVIIPDEDVPLAEVPEVVIPDEDVPLAEVPEVIIPDEDVPLAEIPEEIDIPEEDVPLAEVPKTGDNAWIWTVLALTSGLGLAWLALDGKKRRAE